MGMGSRIEDATLADGGRAVIVCGPLGFQDGDAYAEVAITIRQPGNGEANGSSPPTFVPNGDPNQEWMLRATVHPGGDSPAAESRKEDPRGYEAAWSTAVMVPGPAKAHGVIRYTRQDGTVQTKPWSQDIVLA